MKHFSIILLLLAFSLTGCSTIQTAGIGSNQNIIQTNVNLGSNNFRVVGTSSGTVTYSYILGFGGPAKNIALHNATALMIKNADLVGPQAVANVVTSSEVKTFLGLYTKSTVTVTGQIIEFY